MTTYVIKGPQNSSNYLCTLPAYATPQWHALQGADRFPDAESAWNYIAHLVEKHGTSYVARVVRLNTVHDWRAERARLLAEVDRLREVKHTSGRLANTRDAQMAHARAIKECIQVVKDWDGSSADGQELMRRMSVLPSLLPTNDGAPK